MRNLPPGPLMCTSPGFLTARFLSAGTLTLSLMPSTSKSPSAAGSSTGSLPGRSPGLAMTGSVTGSLTGALVPRTAAFPPVRGTVGRARDDGVGVPPLSAAGCVVGSGVVIVACFAVAPALAVVPTDGGRGNGRPVGAVAPLGCPPVGVLSGASLRCVAISAIEVNVTAWFFASVRPWSAATFHAGGTLAYARCSSNMISLIGIVCSAPSNLRWMRGAVSVIGGIIPGPAIRRRRRGPLASSGCVCGSPLRRRIRDSAASRPVTPGARCRSRTTAVATRSASSSNGPLDAPTLSLACTRPATGLVPTGRSV